MVYMIWKDRQDEFVLVDFADSLSLSMWIGEQSRQWHFVSQLKCPHFLLTLCPHPKVYKLDGEEFKRQWGVTAHSLDVTCLRLWVCAPEFSFLLHQNLYPKGDHVRDQVESIAMMLVIPLGNIVGISHECCASSHHYGAQARIIMVYERFSSLQSQFHLVLNWGDIISYVASTVCFGSFL